jgi:hypothetical protein
MFFKLISLFLLSPAYMVILYYVILCYIMLCYIILYHIISSRPILCMSLSHVGAMCYCECIVLNPDYD